MHHHVDYVNVVLLRERARVKSLVSLPSTTGMQRLTLKLATRAVRWPLGQRLSSSWAVGRTFRSNTRKAVAVCINEVQDELLGEEPRLCLAQVGHAHEAKARLLSEAALAELSCSALLGCTGQEGAGAGASGATGMSLAAIGLPNGNACSIYHFPVASVPQELCNAVGEASDLVVIGAVEYRLRDLFRDLRRHCQEGREQCGVVGGLQVPFIDNDGVGQGQLLVGGEWVRSGAAVGVMSGKRLHTLVSHGCLPVGEVLEVLHAKARIVEQVVAAGEKEPSRNRAVVRLYRELEEDNLLKDGTSVILGMLNEEGADEDDPTSYTLYKVMAVSAETGEMEMEAMSWSGEEFTGKKCRFFVQTKQSSEEDFEKTLRSYPYEKLPQSGAFLFSGHSRQAYEEEHAFAKQHIPGAPLAHMVTAATIVPGALPYATSTASVLAWWE